MRKLLSPLLAALLAAFITGGMLSSCAYFIMPSKSETETGTETKEEVPADTTAAETNPVKPKGERMTGTNEIKDWQGYMPKLGELPDTITVIQNFSGNGELMLALSLQGLTARTKSVLCISGHNADMWLGAIKKQVEGVKTSNVNDVWAALEKFGDMLSRKEYVLYNEKSVNAACTIAAAEGILVASKDEAEKLEQLGYKQAADAQGMTDADAIRAYKNKLNTTALVQQTPSNYALRDLGIAYGLGFYFYNDGNKNEVKESEEIHGYIDEGGIVFGWGPGDEYQHVKIKANHGLITVPSDHAWNLSLFSAFPREQMEQINDYAECITTAADGKHYVALMMTDGDNVQWMVNDFNNPKWFGNAERGSIPMAWMIPPTLLDAAPQTMKWLYLQQTENDVFVNALSGTGYFYPTELKSGAMDKQIQKLGYYMDKCDFDTITIMDNTVPSQKLLDKYASIDKLKGGVLFTYPDKYAGAKGKILWSGDKPFISVRNAIWEVNVDSFAQSVAKSIKKQGYDITTADAYSVIVVHCWSHTYADAVEFAKKLSLLDDKIEFVRVDQLVKLVADNVKH